MNNHEIDALYKEATASEKALILIGKKISENRVFEKNKRIEEMIERLEESKQKFKEAEDGRKALTAIGLQELLVDQVVANLKTIL